MEESIKKIREYARKIQEARSSLMKKQPFYAVLLLNMKISLDSMCETIYTDGEHIAFCPDYLDKLDEQELEFVMMHEVLHAALNHCNRNLDSYDFDDFNTACDIVVNSNILYSFDMDLSKITLNNYGESMHIAPDGKEGYVYTVEEVYRLLQDKHEAEDRKNKKKSSTSDNNEDSKKKEKSDDTAKSDSQEEGNPGDTEDEEEQDYEERDSSEDGNEDEAATPARPDGGFDDHTYWGLDDQDEASDEDGEGEGKKPNTGHNNSYNKVASYDEYSKDELRNAWLQRMIEATIISNKIISIKESHEGYGGPPLMVQRILKELTEPQTDWREILQDFVQEEINDYSFNPPDRRFQEGMFLLPDFNEKESSIKNIWFLIDTSGSIGDNAIRAAYSEICAAIDQFDGKLEGWLSFTESYVTEPIPFSSVEDVMEIKPVGGGGNDFSAIFRYMNENMMDELPAYIIIITDGYDEFPAESEAGGIPVLWLINNEDRNPPWGKVARITID